MSIAVEDFVGLTASRSLSALLCCLEEIQEVRLAELRPLPPIQTRLHLTIPERAVFEKALELRNATGLSFWDSVMLKLPTEPNAFRFLDVVKMHVSLRGQEIPLSRTEICTGGLERACMDFQSATGTSLTLISEVVRRDGSLAHLPMLDFHLFKSASNLEVVKAVAERLFPGGAILLDSGESYHAYGMKLIPQEHFHNFIGTAMLFVPIVDRTYLAHQIIEGRCALRITPGGGKSQTPTVIAA